jgi:hypothetical protein
VVIGERNLRLNRALSGGNSRIKKMMLMLNGGNGRVMRLCKQANVTRGLHTKTTLF